MKIKLDDPSQMLSHVLLADRDLALQVSKTIKKDDNGPTVIATVSFNGVECPAEILEKAMLELFSQIDRQYEEKYADIERAVKRRARSIVSKKANLLIDKMQELSWALDGVERVLDQ